MNCQVWLVLTVILMMSVCSAHYEEMMSPQVYCGRSLARAIAALCYEEGTYDKRSESGTMYNGILAPYYKEHEARPSWPWLAPHKAKGLALPSRGKRQVVDECCNKACNLNELLSYC